MSQPSVALPRRMGTDDLHLRPWLLLPGTLCTGAVFDRFLDALGVPVKLRQPVSLNHPTVEGYGGLLAGLSKETVVCGFSLGALVAAHHAHRMRASRMILFALNPFADQADRAGGRHALAREVAEKGGAVALAPRLPTLHGANPGAVRTAILAMADASAKDIDAHTRLALGRPGAMNALARAKPRLSILTGTEDHLSPVAMGQAAAQVAPHGCFHALPQLGHYALLENPEACAMAVHGMQEICR